MLLAACTLQAPQTPVSVSPNGQSKASVSSLRNELTKQPSAFGWSDDGDLSQARVGAKQTYAFSITNHGLPVKDFAVEHEKLLHFIVVRNDLRDFQHLHPELDQASGRFTVSVTFPENGTYALFADFQPKQGEATVLRKDIVVAAPSKPTTLAADVSAQTTDGYTVTPTVESPLPAGDQMFIFDITKAGKPVTDLQDYLGAKGHAVILKEGTLDYLHAHPADHGGGHGGMVMPGPGEVIFMASLPMPGRYRVFQQYRPDGHLITVANTYEVTALPADTSTGSTTMEAGAPLEEIAIEAFQWGYLPNVIHVKKGTEVMVHLTTRDVAHGFNLPGFDVSETILPGKMTMTTFVADKVGTFTFGCDVACGSGHPAMEASGGTLIVE